MTVLEASNNNIKKIKKDIIPNNVVIFYYYSDKCPYCIMIKGLIKEITEKYKDRKDIIIIKINREILKSLDNSMQIDLVPTIITYKNGNKKSEFKKKREYENIINYIEKNKNII
jgi:thiol-disulfide isomerase/thioredoxin